MGKDLGEEFLLHLVFGQVEVGVGPFFTKIHCPVFHITTIKLLKLLILLHCILNWRLLVFKLNHISVLVLLKQLTLFHAQQYYPMRVIVGSGFVISFKRHQLLLDRFGLREWDAAEDLVEGWDFF